MSEGPHDSPADRDPSIGTTSRVEEARAPLDAAAPESPARGVPATRTSAAFKSLIAGAIVLVLLLVFILENTQSVQISYFGATGHLTLGVALLLAAVGGALLVGAVGAARIAQVRRHAKRRRR